MKSVSQMNEQVIINQQILNSKAFKKHSRNNKLSELIISQQLDSDSKVVKCNQGKA